MEIREVCPEHARIRVGEGAERPALEEAGAVHEIRPVAPDGVRRGVPFGHEVPQERRNGRPSLLVAGRLHALSISRR